MKIALLGFPQAGKKTFFALLTSRRATAAKPLSVKDGEALEGIAPIHDPRVDALAAIFKPEKKRYAENIIVLCPDIDPQGAGRAWLESARQCDLLCLLVRAFTSPEVYHPLGDVNAERDRSNIATELLIADLEIIEKRLERIGKEKKSGSTPRQILEEQCLGKIKEKIEKQMPFDPAALDKQELETVKSLGLLSLKKILWADNVDEDKLNAPGLHNQEKNFTISCRIEEEIMGLENPEERAAYLKELGAASSGLDRLNQAAYDALGLMSFYTVGQDEVRAWTIRKGNTAPEAAGKVHSDIERGFIRAEVIKFDDLVVAGSEAAAKAQGKLQVRGRDYVLEDGDICHFRFNV